MRVYKISTNLTDERNKHLVKNITEEDSIFLASLDIKASVDLLDEEDKLTSIMITNVLNIEKLKTYFNKSNIESDIEDITEYFSQESDEDKLNEIIDELTTEDILKTFGVEI